MGNRVGVVVAVIVLIILAGIGVSVYKNSANSNLQPSPKNEVTASTVPSSSESPKMSLKDLWKSGTSQKCTYSSETATGTVYTSSGKMRGDTIVNTDNQKINTHMLVDEQYSYIWMDNQAQGMKMSLDAVEKPSNASASGNVDINQKYPVDCKPWVVDNSMFTLPVNIKFQDISAMMKGTVKPGGPGAVDSTSLQCSTCDQLTGEAKNQCRQALKCQ